MIAFKARDLQATKADLQALRDTLTGNINRLVDDVGSATGTGAGNLLSTPREHVQAINAVQRAAADALMIVDNLAELCVGLTVHRVMTRELSGAADEGDIAILSTALGREALALLARADEDTDPAHRYWRAETVSHLARHRAEIQRVVDLETESRKCAAACGLDYDKMLAGDAAEIAKGRQHGFAPVTVEEAAHGRAPEVHVVNSVNELMEHIRRRPAVHPGGGARTGRVVHDDVG